MSIAGECWQPFFCLINVATAIAYFRISASDVDIVSVIEKCRLNPESWSYLVGLFGNILQAHLKINLIDL